MISSLMLQSNTWLAVSGDEYLSVDSYSGLVDFKTYDILITKTHDCKFEWISDQMLKQNLIIQANSHF